MPDPFPFLLPQCFELAPRSRRRTAWLLLQGDPAVGACLLPLSDFVDKPATLLSLLPLVVDVLGEDEVAEYRAALARRN